MASMALSISVPNVIKLDKLTQKFQKFQTDQARQTSKILDLISHHFQNVLDLSMQTQHQLEILEKATQKKHKLLTCKYKKSW